MIGGENVSKKNAIPTKEQQEVLKKNGLRPYEWTVVKDLRNTMIVRNRHTNDVKMIEK